MLRVGDLDRLQRSWLGAREALEEGAACRFVDWRQDVPAFVLVQSACPLTPNAPNSGNLSAHPS
jgi:hypothetical protein